MAQLLRVRVVEILVVGGSSELAARESAVFRGGGGGRCLCVNSWRACVRLERGRGYAVVGANSRGGGALFIFIGDSGIFHEPRLQPVRTRTRAFVLVKIASVWSGYVYTGID